MQLKEKLIKHMVDTEDNRDRLLNEAVSQEEKKEMAGIVDNYLRTMEDFIQNNHLKKETRPPFAIIGSRVTVENKESGETWTVRLSSPLHEIVEAEDVSFISPLGKALLLKKEGDQIEALTAEGKRLLFIKQVHPPDLLSWPSF